MSKSHVQSFGFSHVQFCVHSPLSTSRICAYIAATVESSPLQKYMCAGVKPHAGGKSGPRWLYSLCGEHARTLSAHDIYIYLILLCQFADPDFSSLRMRYIYTIIRIQQICRVRIWVLIRYSCRVHGLRRV